MFSAAEINHYWFHSFPGEHNSLKQKSQIWFSVERSRDRKLRRRFITYTIMAAEGGLDSWSNSAEGALARILLLDRFTRSAFRNTDLAFGNDKIAQTVCLEGLEQSLDLTLATEQRMFFYFPLLAAEKRSLQEQALNLYRQLQASCVDEENKSLIASLTTLAERNLLLLKRYKCFPHRKKVLGQRLNAAEQEFCDAYDWEYWL